jgi:hypothetical protein
MTKQHFGILVLTLLAVSCNQQQLKTNLGGNSTGSEETKPASTLAGSWQSYKNAEYGYAVEYPEGWSIDRQRTTPSEVVFNTGLPESHVSISVRQYSGTLTDWVAGLDQSSLTSKQPEVVSGEPAFRIQTGELGGNMVSIVHHGRLYILYSIPDDVLNRFKFTN